jgi:hypothetical protein
VIQVSDGLQRQVLLYNVEVVKPSVERAGRETCIGGPLLTVPPAWTFERDGETMAVDLQPHFSTGEMRAA